MRSLVYWLYCGEACAALFCSIYMWTIVRYKMSEAKWWELLLIWRPLRRKRSLLLEHLPMIMRVSDVNFPSKLHYLIAWHILNTDDSRQVRDFGIRRILCAIIQAMEQYWMAHWPYNLNTSWKYIQWAKSRISEMRYF